jgi:hypothetical protein
MLTDDPGTPGSGAWEINFAYLEQRTDQELLRSFPHVDFNYGLGGHIQLKYETGWLFAEAPLGSSAKSGLDDSLFGVKWRFLDQERSGVDMSVYPQLQVENSTGSVSRGIADPGPNLFLPVEISHDFGKTRLVGEVGYQYFHAQDNQWVVGILGALEMSDTFELLAEVRSYSEKFLNGGDLILNVGMRLALSTKLKLLASAGTGFTNGPGTTTFIAYLGVQVLLGEK